MILSFRKTEIFKGYLNSILFKIFYVIALILLLVVIIFNYYFGKIKKITHNFFVTSINARQDETQTRFVKAISMLSNILHFDSLENQDVKKLILSSLCVFKGYDNSNLFYSSENVIRSIENDKVKEKLCKLFKLKNISNTTHFNKKNKLLDINFYFLSNNDSYNEFNFERQRIGQLRYDKNKYIEEILKIFSIYNEKQSLFDKNRLLNFINNFLGKCNDDMTLFIFDSLEFLSLILSNIKIKDLVISSNEKIIILLSILYYNEWLNEMKINNLIFLYKKNDKLDMRPKVDYFIDEIYDFILPERNKLESENLIIGIVNLFNIYIYRRYTSIVNQCLLINFKQQKHHHLDNKLIIALIFCSSNASLIFHNNLVLTELLTKLNFNIEQSIIDSLKNYYLKPLEKIFRQFISI